MRVTLVFPSRYIILLLCVVASALPLWGQFYDNTWLLGYPGGDDAPPPDSFGLSILTFDEADLTIESDPTFDLYLQGGTVAASDAQGSLIFYSDVVRLRKPNHTLLEDGLLTLNTEDLFRLIPQAMLIVPQYTGMDTANYQVFRAYPGEHPQISHTLTRSVVTFANNQVSVKLKNELLLEQESITNGMLTATRHANGRDWWILVSQDATPKYFTFLVTPDSTYLHHTQAVAVKTDRGLGQSVFSPNGAYYARFNLVGSPGDDPELDIFRFDRCTGMLSEQLRSTDFGAADGFVGYSGGIAFSPNSRFLYVSHYEYLYQYDLWADDVLASKDTVGIYDGYTEWDFFHSRFFMQQLAPDGKIYMNISSGAKVLHVIHQPDEPGELCQFEQHGVHLPMNNAFALANHPNYRLGPLDGSPCDTLGLDNWPRAYYRTDRDTSDALAFAFHDLSFYEPTSWSWTFGDGGTSTQRHPTHNYASTGTYEVCLTVSNANGSDTHCRTYTIGTVGTTEPPPSIVTRVFPNPATEVLYVDIEDYVPVAAYCTLYDALGRPVLRQRLWQRQTTLQIGHLPQGVYTYAIEERGLQLGSGKVVVQ